MKIDIVDLYEEFYEREKDNYNLEFKQMRDLIKTPWIYLKHQMENGLLPTVRFMYFGVFTVYQGRAKFMKKRTQENYDKGYISESRYKKYMDMLNNFLNRQNEKNK